MNARVHDLVDSALRLSQQERANLAARLIESLDADEEGHENAQAAWDDEIRRRLQELDTGEVTPIPWAQAREMILGTRKGPAAS